MLQKINESLEKCYEQLQAGGISFENWKAAQKKASNLKKYIQVLKIDKSEAVVAKTILKMENLEVTDDQIWEKIEEDDIVEAYDTDNIQLYCNTKLLQETTYYLEDFLLNDVFDLFIRPESILKTLKNSVAIVMQQTENLLRMKVPAYVLQEKFSMEKAKFKIQHKYLCAIQDKTSKQKVGVLSILKAQRVPQTASISVLEKSNSSFCGFHISNTQPKGHAPIITLA